MTAVTAVTWCSSPTRICATSRGCATARTSAPSAACTARAPGSTGAAARTARSRCRSARRCGCARPVTLVADLAHAGARVVVARGGQGGAGNRRFATATRQAPRHGAGGGAGEERDARAAPEARWPTRPCSGFPNVGKSTLLRRISNATPKVADYPFTTIEPVLGTVEAADGRQLTVVDVPGLLEGASHGVGLGHEFLAHLERARLLVHLIDASAGAEDIARRRTTIDRELALARPAGLRSAADKLDRALEDRPRRAGATEGAACSRRRERRWPAPPRRARGSPSSSTRSSSGSPPRRSRPRPSSPSWPTSSCTARRRRRGERSGSCATAASCGSRAAASSAASPTSTPTTTARSESLATELERLGVDRALHAAGARPGDDVLVGAHRFTYRPRR